MKDARRARCRRPGSNPATGGNPGGYRLGGLDRNATAGANDEIHAVHREGYDPSVLGPITGITYQEDRYASLASPQPGEGLEDGLWLVQDIGQHVVLADQVPPFLAPGWTTFSVHFELDQLDLDPNVPFHVGYARRVLTYPGTGTLEHGIDNPQFSICR